MEESFVLITGATGFIGRRVCARMAGEGISMLATGRSHQALEALAREVENGGGRLEAAALDWCDRTQAASIPDRWPGLTHIVHLASPVPGPSGDNVPMLAEGLSQVMNLLEIAERLSVRHVTLVSSVAVYGRHATGGIAESAAWSADVGPYGMMKRVAEELVGWWGSEREVPVAVLRPAQVYGPGEPHGLGLSRMICSALQGDTLTLQNGGEDTRDIVFVDDVARAIVTAVQQCAAGVYNISGGTAHTIREMASCIMAAIQGAGHGEIPLEIRSVTTTVMPTWYGNEAAAKALGLRPTPLAAGVARTVEFEHGHKEDRA